MAGRSALINVMHKASIASRRMMRDFGRWQIRRLPAKGQQILSLRQYRSRTHYPGRTAKRASDWGFMEEAGEVKPADKDALLDRPD